MNKKDYEKRKKQVEAHRMLSILEPEIEALLEEQAGFRKHGISSRRLKDEIKFKQAQAKVYRKITKEKIPASAFALPHTNKNKSLKFTRESQMRPVQGGGVSPK